MIITEDTTNYSLCQRLIALLISPIKINCWYYRAMAKTPETKPIIKATKIW